jgi:hypothetical protein
MKARREPRSEGTESSEVRTGVVGSDSCGLKPQRERPQPPSDLIVASARKIRVVKIVGSNGPDA